MKSFILFTHAAISLLFFATMIFIVISSIIGLKKDKNFSKFDKRTTVSNLILLYLQSALGFFLYFINKKQELVDLDNIIQNSLIRFWEVEHIILMLFAIAIAQVGYFIILNSNTSQTKFKKRLIYYSVVLALVTASLFLALYK